MRSGHVLPAGPQAARSAGATRRQLAARRGPPVVRQMLSKTATRRRCERSCERLPRAWRPRMIQSTWPGCASWALSSMRIAHLPAVCALRCRLPSGRAEHHRGGHRLAVPPARSRAACSAAATCCGTARASRHRPVVRRVDRGARRADRAGAAPAWCTLRCRRRCVSRPRGGCRRHPRGLAGQRCNQHRRCPQVGAAAARYSPSPRGPSVGFLDPLADRPSCDGPAGEGQESPSRTAVQASPLDRSATRCRGGRDAPGDGTDATPVGHPRRRLQPDGKHVVSVGGIRSASGTPLREKARLVTAINVMGLAVRPSANCWRRRRTTKSTCGT